MTLLKQQAKGEWVSVLVWSLLLGAVVLSVVTLYNYLAHSEMMASLQQMLAQMPPSMAALYGANAPLATLNGWLSTYAFGGGLAIPMVIFTGLFAAGMVTREMDRRTIEFVLSLPVTRRQWLFSRWLGLLLALVVLHLVQLLVVVVGVKAIGEGLTLGSYVIAELNSLLLYLALGGLCLLVSLFINEYGSGLAATLGLGLGLFFFHAGTETSTGAAKALHNALPFAHLNPGDIIGKGLVPWGDMAVLALIALVTLGLSLVVFERKQITV